MAVANSKLRRAEPRTAADLRERGFKLVCLGRPTFGGYRGLVSRRDLPPPDYKLVRVDARPDSPWYGLIRGPAHKSTAHLRSGRYFAKRPIGRYESRVAAAHAILDRLEKEGRL